MISVRWSLVHFPRGSSWNLRHKELHETRRVQEHCDRIIYKQCYTFLQPGRYKMPVSFAKKLIFLMQNFYNLTIYKILIFLVQSLYMIYKKTDVSYAKFVYNHIQNVHTKYHNFLQRILVFSCLYLLSVALIMMWNETQ